MAKYIDSGAFQAALVRKQCGPANQRYTDGWNDCLLRVKSMVSKAPAANVAPVVRCKDCKHLVAVNVNGKGIPTCRMSGMEVASAEFCSRGEKGRK